MDSTFILCSLLLGIRLIRALTPDEYITLRRQNQTSHTSAIKPSSVQIFMHPPTNQRNAKILPPFHGVHRHSQNPQAPSPSERYSQYQERPVVPKKHYPTNNKPAFAVSKYDDYYPVRKPDQKAKHQQIPSDIRNPKRPVQPFAGNAGLVSQEQGNSNGRIHTPSENLREVNVDETPSGEHRVYNNKKQEYRKETKSTSASEQVQKLTLQTDDDRMFVAATGYGGNTRGQFHEQGMQGPHSYKFGYNTGDTFNPMARYEERDADGFVRGSYSFVDALGKHQVVHYESHPEFGFKTKSGHGSYPY